jgi:ATP-binding protein involved in chromosome partitioning
MIQAKIISALGSVIDPTTGQNIIERGMVADIVIHDDDVRFSLALPNLSAELKSQLNFACIAAINEVYPHARVHVHMTMRSAANSTDDNPLAHIRNIIAVASGKGGVGKSTVAVNLALALSQQGARVGLIDADLYGPSIPTMLGLRGKRPLVQDVYGKPKIVPLEAYGISVMSIGFIVDEQQAVVLRGPRLAAILKQFFWECLWQPLDYLIIDLPPGTGDIQLTLVQTVPVTGAVLVTTPQEVALADAVKAMNMFLLPSVNVPILGVVENMSWFTPAELPNNKYYLFGKGGGEKLAVMANSVLLGQIPLVQSIREYGDAGTPEVLNTDSPSATVFRDIADKLVARIQHRNDTQAPSQKVHMQ